MNDPIKMDNKRRSIEEFCKRWKIQEFSLFGSVLREDFDINSDVDVLVTLDPNSRCSLFDMVKMKRELEQVFGREVDLLSRRGIEASSNYLRRKAILYSARILYAE